MIHYRKAGENKGYAVVAAMMILLMVTGLGVLSMFTSVSEQYLTTNLAEDQYVFSIAEQSMDRILSHLHYMEGGLFTLDSSATFGLGYDPAHPTTTYTNPNVSNTLSPKQVLKEASALIMGTSNNYIASNSSYKIDAWLDPKDFDGWWDRGISRPVTITARVTAFSPSTSSTLFSRVFRVRAKPRSVWDFAYYVGNNRPTERNTNRWGQTCAGDTAASSWRNCQTVLMSGSNVANAIDNAVSKDRFEGDVYAGNVLYTLTGGFSESFPDTNPPSRLFMRGVPDFRGQVRWRSPYFYETARNQTVSGSGSTFPTADRSMRPNAKSVLMPQLDVLTGNTGGGYHNTSPQVYDMILRDPTPTSSTYKWAYRIIFRNDINSNNSPAPATEPYVIPPSEPIPAIGKSAMYRVASAITASINPGTGPNWTNYAGDDPGVMMIYKVPLKFIGTPSQAQSDVEEQYMRAAFYGDTMKKRHIAMTTTIDSRSGAIWTPGGWSHLTENRRCSTAFNPDDTWATARGDIDDTTSTGLPGAGTYHYVYVPSRGEAVTPVGTGACVGSGTYNGIIYVEGDVIVSGILDGQLTIVASGDIYIDHEIEYENSPTRINASSYLDPKQADMLGLFAGGNIIIPNSFPEARLGLNAAVMRNHSYRDDWSDPTFNPASLPIPFVPAGQTDQVPVYDDIGDEDIHAVMMSYGQVCTAASGVITCNAPTAANVQNFAVGLHATPRTYNTLRNRALPNDSAYPPPFSTFDNSMTGGNSSGRLTIVGAVIQNIPGRLAYDYFTGGGQDASCTNGEAATCNRIGFAGVNYIRDPRLDYMLPPMPRLATTYGKAPYGYASWDILSWEELSNSTDISGAVW